MLSEINQTKTNFLLSIIYVFPGGSVVKNPPANAGATGDAGSILGSGRSPGKGICNPLQYSGMDRGAWPGYSPWGRKESDTT